MCDLCWPSPIFLEILLVIWWSLQIRLSRNFPGNMQVLPKILQLTELSWAPRPKISVRTHQNSLFWRRWVQISQWTTRSVSEVLHFWHFFDFFAFFAFFFFSGTCDANFRGGARGNVSGNVEISRNISGYLLVSNICMQKDFLERRRCLRGKIDSCQRALSLSL